MENRLYGKIIVNWPKRAVRIGENFKISLIIPNGYGIVENACILFCRHGSSEQKRFSLKYIETQNQSSIFSVNVRINEIDVYYFYLALQLNGRDSIIKYDYYSDNALIDNGGLWKLIVCDSKFNAPNWAESALYYHIFVDRFFKSEKYRAIAMAGRTQLRWGEMPVWKPDADGMINNIEFFMGNLLGVVEKLEYLSELGIEIIYLSPIVLSQSNHRYDAANYKEVDPYCGNEKMIKLLCKEAKKKGIRIVLDGVFNHTGNLSKYFNEYSYFDTIGACQGEKSPYYPWYKRDSKGNQQFWWGFKNLPEVNSDNPEWVNFICGVDGVIDKWFQWGISGVRLDVADELSDAMISQIKTAVQRNKVDGLIIGEVWDNPYDKENRYGKNRNYLLGPGMNSVMNYPMTQSILKYVRSADVECFKNTARFIKEQYPKSAISSAMTALSTHDIPRALSVLGGNRKEDQYNDWYWDAVGDRKWQYENDELPDYEKAKKMFKIASIIQYFFMGSPCLFYGDEAGLYGYKDPFNRKCYPWGNEDKDLISFFMKLGQFRKNVNMKELEYSIIEINSDYLIFERLKEGNPNSVFIAVNRTDTALKICIPDKYQSENLKKFNLNSNGNIMNPYGAIIIAI